MTDFKDKQATRGQGFLLYLKGIFSKVYLILRSQEWFTDFSRTLGSHYYAGIWKSVRV